MLTRSQVQPIWPVPGVAPAEPESEAETALATEATLEAATGLKHAPWLSSSRSALLVMLKTHSCHCSHC